jgi:WD40 repeat protein
MEGHIDCIDVISVTPDNKRAITGSKDKTIRIWNLELR